MNKVKDKEYPKLNVCTFGEFQISNEKGILNIEKIHSEMLTRLLAYMVCHRDKSITVQELVEVLWAKGESANPSGALKNLMYRLRNLLKKTWGNYDFIIARRGLYQWNPHIVLNVDAEDFEQCCKEIGSESSVEKQIQKASCIL